MLLSSEEADQFHSLYHGLIGFVCARAGGVDGIVDIETFREADLTRKGQARDRLYERIELIGEFIDENPGGFREQELGIVAGWKRYLRGRFLIERDLKKYTVFLSQDGEQRAYGVLGLTTEIPEMLPQPLPAFVEAVLLPWRNKIVCDGLLGGFNVFFGAGARRSFKEAYKTAKTAGIITSLDPDWQPPAPKASKKPTTPAIKRFIKRCPKSVAEVERRFGLPGAVLAGGDVGEYCLWQIDATPVAQWDRVLVYPNVIAKHDLYLFVSGEEIVHLSAPPRLQWSKTNMRAPEGWRLLR